MDGTDTQIEHAGASLVLSPDATAYWAQERTLFVADTHFGKTAAFRAAGVPAPERTTGTDLERLTRALERTGASTLVVLGDFLHAKSGRTEPVHRAISAWRTLHPSVEITLVRGNHDRSAGDPSSAWKIRVVDPGHCLGPFTLLHEPSEKPDPSLGNGMAGHVHPAVRMKDRATRSGVRLACFWKRSDCLVLPAFGSFTGTHIVTPRPGDDVRACAGGRLFSIGDVLSR